MGEKWKTANNPVKTVSILTSGALSPELTQKLMLVGGSLESRWQ
jgi:hypothetical protein